MNIRNKCFSDEEEVWKMCVNSGAAWRLCEEEEKKICIYFNILKMFKLIEQIHSMNHQPKAQRHSAWMHIVNRPLAMNVWMICIQCAVCLCNVQTWSTLPNMLIGWFRVIWNFLKAIECLDNKIRNNKLDINLSRFVQMYSFIRWA